MKLVAALLWLCASLPITIYLQYQILKRVDASELMWFLFWVNVPVLFFAALISRLLEKK